MRKFIVRTDVNGGEYSSYHVVIADTIDLDMIDDKTIVFNNVLIQYDEIIEEIYETDINDGYGISDYNMYNLDDYKLLYNLDDYKLLYSIYNADAL